MIPAPVSYIQKPGHFELTATTPVTFHTGSESAKAAAQALVERLRPATGWFWQIEPDSTERTGGIHFFQADLDPILGLEGYEIDVREDGVKVCASGGAGLFYGAQTLLSLLPPEVFDVRKREGGWQMECSHIRDWPRFSWRESMLDSCRHMQSVAYIKRHLDLMALLKLNRFHWHLTEDQGWRIEIHAFPKLTEVGAWRIEEDGTRYGGFYTQDEVREVVAYAKARHIEVVPEFEMPGHSLAALAAYPELSCAGGPFEPTPNWGIFDDIYCAGNDLVFAFIEKVWDELLELFPYEYVHIGGDEAPKVRWENCPKCAERMNVEGLKDAFELQSWFIRKVEAYLASNGRKLIGWDEIHEGGLPPTATVQWWRGWMKDVAVEAAQKGHAIVSTPTSHCYLDYGFDDFGVEHVYGFDPIPEGLDPEAGKYVIGGGGNMWTERTPTEADMDRQIWPRMAAIAECLWTPAGGKSWQSFTGRLPALETVFDAWGVRSYRGG